MREREGERERERWSYGPRNKATKRKRKTKIVKESPELESQTEIESLQRPKKVQEGPSLVPTSSKSESSY